MSKEFQMTKPKVKKKVRRFQTQSYGSRKGRVFTFFIWHWFDIWILEFDISFIPRRKPRCLYTSTSVGSVGRFLRWYKKWTREERTWNAPPVAKRDLKRYCPAVSALQRALNQPPPPLPVVRALQDIAEANGLTGGSPVMPNSLLNKYIFPNPGFWFSRLNPFCQTRAE